MNERAEAFCAGIFAREIQVKPETMVKRLIMMHSLGKEWEIKGISLHHVTWNCSPFVMKLLEVALVYNGLKVPSLLPDIY